MALSNTNACHKQDATPDHHSSQNVYPTEKKFSKHLRTFLHTTRRFLKNAGLILSSGLWEKSQQIHSKRLLLSLKQARKKVVESLVFLRLDRTSTVAYLAIVLSFLMNFAPDLFPESGFSGIDHANKSIHPSYLFGFKLEPLGYFYTIHALMVEICPRISVTLLLIGLSVFVPRLRQPLCAMALFYGYYTCKTILLMDMISASSAFDLYFIGMLGCLFLAMRHFDAAKKRQDKVKSHLNHKILGPAMRIMGLVQRENRSIMLGEYPEHLDGVLDHIQDSCEGIKGEIVRYTYNSEDTSNGDYVLNL